jgi:hypothetical protein
MKEITIKLNEYSSLKATKEHYIILKRIVPSRGERSLLSLPIQVHFDFGEKGTFDDLIHPMSYFSIYEKAIRTHKDINYIIRDSENAQLKIIQPANDSIEQYTLQLYYEEHRYLIDELIIYVVHQMDGYTYSLPPRSKQILTEKFDTLIPTGNILIPFGVHESFELIYGPLQEHIIPTLLGLPTQEIKKIGKLTFLDPRTNTVIYERS